MNTIENSIKLKSSIKDKYKIYNNKIFISLLIVSFIYQDVVVNN